MRGRGALTSLGQLQPGGRSWASAINDAGVVVGQASVDERDHAFRWTPDAGMVDLNPPDAEESYAPGIDDKGAIVAWYWTVARDARGLYIAADGTSTRLDCRKWSAPWRPMQARIRRTGIASKARTTWSS